MPLALTSAVGPLAAALETLVPALEPLASAFSLLAQQVQNTINKMEAWANALSPATIFSFEYSLRNLQATLGQAVVPMFQVLIGVVDRFAGILSPVAQALAPVFHSLADVLGGVFLNVTRTLAGAFAGLLPVIESFMPMFNALGGLVATLVEAFVPLLAVLGAILVPFNAAAAFVSELLRALQEVTNIALTPLTLAAQLLALALSPLTDAMAALDEVMVSFHDITRAVQIVFKSMYEAIASWFKGFVKTFFDLSGVVDAVKKAFQEAAKAVILFSARMALLFGGTDFVQRLIKNLGPEGNEHGVVAAPQNVRIQDFAGIAKDLVQASFAAGPGGENKTERDYLREMVPLLQKMLDNPQSIKDEMIKGFNEVIEKLKALIPDTFKPGNAGDPFSREGAAKRRQAAAAAVHGAAAALGIHF